MGSKSMGSKSMKSTTTTMKAANCAMESATTPAVKPTAASPVKATTPAAAASATTATSGDGRDIRHDAKRAHRDACRQNSY
jgi:hypothetical protein